MQVTIELPDEIAAELMPKNGAGLPRVLLEMVALEGYRSGELTEAEVMRILGFPHRAQVDAFLKAHEASLDYSPSELEDERRTLRELRGR